MFAAIVTIGRSCGVDVQLEGRLSTERRRGTAATELALTLPLLIALTLGCVDLGRVCYAYLIVSNAARCGAEYGATHQFTDFTRPFWDSQVEQLTTEEMSQLPGFDAGRLDIEIEIDEDSGPQRSVAVEVRYPFETIVNWPGVPAEIDLWRHVSMRQVR